MRTVRCIFCKANSDASTSVEHIVPESLGNVEHTLPPGWVCDRCNNYLAREVEKPFLDTHYGRSSRFFMGVWNKRGRIPSVLGLHPQSRSKIEIFDSSPDGLCIGAAPGEDESRWIASVMKRESGSLYIPAPEMPEPDAVTSRFIGKIALEVLAHRCAGVAGWNDEIADKRELDELRCYVRTGLPKIIWPLHMRRIYPYDFGFESLHYGPHEVLHEFTILVTPQGEYYGVVAIFGIEYVINLGGPELDGFHAWLGKNSHRSPLYP